MVSGLMGTNGKGAPVGPKPWNLGPVCFLNAREGDLYFQSLLWRPYTVPVDKPSPPEYKENHRAQDIFSDKYFYDGDAADAAFSSAKREAEFGQMPLHEAAKKWNSPEKQMKLAEKIRATQSVVVDFMRRAPIERRLCEEILAVNEDQELKQIRDRHVSIPTINKQMNRLHEAQLEDRAKQIIYVMGPSGSGKTFFSVMESLSEEIGRQCTARCRWHWHHREAPGNGFGLCQDPTEKVDER
jgi:hypothetical protein